MPRVTIGVFSAGLPGVQHTEVTIVTLVLLSVLTDPQTDPQPDGAGGVGLLGLGGLQV